MLVDGWNPLYQNLKPMPLHWLQLPPQNHHWIRQARRINSKDYRLDHNMKKRAPEAEVFTAEDGPPVVLLHAHAPQRLEAENALAAAGHWPGGFTYLGSKGNKHRYMDGAGNNLLVTISDKGVAVEPVVKEMTP